MKRKLRLLIVPLLLAFPCLRAQEAVPPPAAPRPQDPDPVWATTFSEAVERARAIPEGRVLVELRDARCPDCDRMADLVYPSPSFRSFVRDKVPVRLLRSSPDGKRLSEKFGVRVTPAWVVVTPDLLLSAKQEGASNQSTWIERFVLAERAWGLYLRKLEAEKSAPTDPAATFAVADEAFRRYGDAMAEERFRRVVDDPKAPADLREKSLSYLASIALEARRLDDAEKALHGILATTKDPVVREKAELRLADVDIGRGERTKAAERLKAFLDKHPASPMRPQAQELLEALGTAKP
jgi:hypothetical protein